LKKFESSEQSHQQQIPNLKNPQAITSLAQNTKSCLFMPYMTFPGNIGNLFSKKSFFYRKITKIGSKI
jgi:hypothetical protein